MAYRKSEDREDRFDFRAEVNRERWLFLSRDKEFLGQIQNIRKVCNIPEGLEVFSDMKTGFIPVGDEDVDVAESQWVWSLNKKDRKKFEAELEDVLRRYRLPRVFSSFILHLILYRRLPEGLPLDDWELFPRLFENPLEVRQMDLTANEKFHARAYFRAKLGIKNGRVPDEYKNLYKKFTSELKSSKNVHRRSPHTLKTLEILIRKEKPWTERDNATGKEIQKRRTYMDIAAELDPEENISLESDKKVAARLRKRVSRLQARNSRPKRKPRK